MDQRQTFKDAQQLFSFISQIFQEKQTAALLIDKDGLTRVEGIITSIQPNANVEETLIKVDENTTFTIKEIIAVNGLFRSDYSEC